MRLEISDAKSALLVFLASLVLTMAVAVDPAAAQPRYGQSGAEPLDRLLPEIRRSHPGQVYDAEGPMPGPNGQPQYRLKWMTPDGRIVWFDADARTGRVLGYENGASAPPPRYSSPAPPYSYPQPPQENPRNRFGRDSRYNGSRSYEAPSGRTPPGAGESRSRFRGGH